MIAMPDTQMIYYDSSTIADAMYYDLCTFGDEHVTGIDLSILAKEYCLDGSSLDRLLVPVL